MNNTQPVKKKFSFAPHVVKRDTLAPGMGILIRTVAIVGALILCALLAAILMQVNPFEFVWTLIDGTVGSPRRIWKFAKGTAVLLCIALAVTPAFRMKFWNIGAEGQTLVGALAAAAVAFYSQKILTAFSLELESWNWLILIFMFVAAVLAGAIWALIPAIFKAIWNTNETLFTLMMNYVASGLVAFFLMIWTPSGSSVLGELEAGHLPKIFNNEYILLIVAVLVLTAIIYVYLRYTKQGYEISVVGESENTARYIGIGVGKVIIRTMIVSGAICGLAGFLIVGALDHSITETTVGGMGFTAIMASWLAKFNPLIMIGTSGFITLLQQGAEQISTNFNVDSSFPSMIVGIFLFFIIGCEFFINYRLKFGKMVPVNTVTKGEAK